MKKNMGWPLTDYAAILKEVDSFDPSRYAATRNFIDGSVSRLSPYISRGVISTRMVYERMVAKNPQEAKGKFAQELLWRDYFQRLLQARPDLPTVPIRDPATPNEAKGMPAAVLNAATGILAIDHAIRELYETGYLHNHFRMYVAALCCTVSPYNFTVPANWMYFHLLDADMASNYASWQWVAGHLTGKSYTANQENIDRYSKQPQPGTFLDTTYDSLTEMPVPEILTQPAFPVLETSLPVLRWPQLTLDPVLLYTHYNLDPAWKPSGRYNRVLILEPSHFQKFPLSEKVLQFVLDLAQNIDGIQIFTGGFEALQSAFPGHTFIAKEHPILKFKGAQAEERDWIVPQLEGFFPSFSNYYSKCQKYLTHEK